MEERQSRFINIEMMATEQPTFKPVKNGDYISYGKNNDYPNYLIELYNRCAEHNTAINAKASYLFGKGLTYTKTGDTVVDAKIEKFLNKANRFESWNDLLPKSCINFELIDGFYFQHIVNKGKIVGTYNIDTPRMRASLCGTFYWYCKDWSDRKAERKKYPVYNENATNGTYIRYVKVHKPSADKLGDTYSIPNYTGCLSSIETEINIDVFFNSLTEHGMTAQGMLSLFNGEPTDDEKRIIKKMFEKNYTGPSKAGKFLLNFVNPEGKPAELLNFSASDLDKQFEILGKRNIQKICVGHRVDPILIGIDNATSWTRTQILEKWEKFQTTYVNPRQEVILEVIQAIADNNGVPSKDIYIEDLPPIGEEIELGESTFNEVLTIEEKRNYLRDKKGVVLSSLDEESTTSRLSIAQKLGVGGTASLQAVIVDPTMSPDQKLNIMVGLYSVPEKKARKMLNMVTPLPTDVAMSEQKDEVLTYLLSVGRPINDDEVLETKFVDFDSEGKMFEFEKAQVNKFEEVLGATVKAVRNQILDILAGDPFIKPEIIAKQLGTDVEYVNEQINQLIETKVLEASGNGFNITEKGLNRAENVEPVIEYEIYTMYQYAKRPDVSGSAVMPTTRSYCADLMNAGLEFSREDLSKEVNENGDSAWIYRGGFFNNGKETTPYCRHIWKAITKQRKKNA